ncbi:hypothetical protein RKE25_22835 (plasmid) [Dyella sp. BiH032]|uniref:hypothetical protein n=1 Tax=Dyella sp. BiH032 TaxID=3075430 RepID=UPI0028931990|nr:hypothetical protein [Dyella sp. BiH032]WNL48372.1 hypothetical protein RKE25_22835 [Dyella sp. BiH032]
MKEMIKGSFNADGVAWDYEAWFAQDNEGTPLAAIRHRRQGTTDAWTPTTPITLHLRHAYTLEQLAFAHFGSVLDMSVEEGDFVKTR